MAGLLETGSLARVTGENSGEGPGPHYIVPGSIVQVEGLEYRDIIAPTDTAVYRCRVVLGAFDPEVYVDYFFGGVTSGAEAHPWCVVASCLEPVEQVPQ